MDTICWWLGLHGTTTRRTRTLLGYSIFRLPPLSLFNIQFRHPISLFVCFFFGTLETGLPRMLNLSLVNIPCVLQFTWLHRDGCFEAHKSNERRPRESWLQRTLDHLLRCFDWTWIYSKISSRPIESPFSPLLFTPAHPPFSLFNVNSDNFQISDRWPIFSVCSVEASFLCYSLMVNSGSSKNSPWQQALGGHCFAAMCSLPNSLYRGETHLIERQGL